MDSFSFGVKVGLINVIVPFSGMGDCQGSRILTGIPSNKLIYLQRSVYLLERYISLAVTPASQECYKE